MKKMRTSRHHILLSLLLALVTAFAVVPVAAQVTVNDPAGLLKRTTPAKQQSQGSNAKHQSQQAAPNKQQPAASPAEQKAADPDAAEPARPSSNSKRADASKLSISSQTVQGRSNGYRVQLLFSSAKNAKQQAYSLAKQVAAKFPQYRTYVSYNAPQWRLRLGDFTSRNDANKVMRRIRKAFPKMGQMTVVHDVVNRWGN